MGTAELIRDNAKAEYYCRGALGAMAALSVGTVLLMPVMIYRGTSLVKTVGLGMLANGAGAGGFHLALDHRSALQKEWETAPKAQIDESQVANSLGLFPQGYRCVNIDLKRTNLKLLQQIEITKESDWETRMRGPVMMVGAVSYISFGAGVIGCLVQGWRQRLSLAVLAPVSILFLSGGVSIGTQLLQHIRHGSPNYPNRFVASALEPVILAELDRLAEGASLNSEDREWVGDQRNLAFDRLTQEQFTKLIDQLRLCKKSPWVSIWDSSQLNLEKVQDALNKMAGEDRGVLCLTFNNGAHLRELQPVYSSDNQCVVAPRMIW